MITLREFFEKQSKEQKKKLQTCLGISSQLIDHWMSEDTAPKPETAYELIEYTRGLLSWDGIYLPFVLKKINTVNPNQLKLPVE